MACLVFKFRPNGNLHALEEHRHDDGYDWDLSTSDNYSSGCSSMIGPFASIRNSLDLSHHGCYTLHRQKLQDALIQSVIGTGEACQNPWMIFTAGSFMSGKSYLLKWLQEHDYVPNAAELVVTDPDRFRTLLPEWPEYLRRNAFGAALLTQKESGTCALISQWEAMRLRRNIWVDGSLQNGERQEAFFKEIRASHPWYRIAIVHVTASWETIVARSPTAREGGRVVDIDSLQRSFEAVGASVSRLTPLSDLIVQVDNSEDLPRLVGVSMHGVETERLTWETVRSLFLPGQEAVMAC